MEPIGYQWNGASNSRLLPPSSTGDLWQFRNQLLGRAGHDAIQGELVLRDRVIGDMQFLGRLPSDGAIAAVPDLEEQPHASGLGFDDAQPKDSEPFLLRLLEALELDLH